jgi:hypothetical protein
VCLLRGTFFPHSVFMCFVWIWDKQRLFHCIALDDWFFITETECVYCAVRKKFFIRDNPYSWRLSSTLCFWFTKRIRSVMCIVFFSWYNRNHSHYLDQIWWFEKFKISGTILTKFGSFLPGFQLCYFCYEINLTTYCVTEWRSYKNSLKGVRCSVVSWKCKSIFEAPKMKQRQRNFSRSYKAKKCGMKWLCIRARFSAGIRECKVSG